MREPAPDTPPRRAIVLVVDDEPVVTQSLTALLELETDYRILSFQSPVEALAAAESSHIDLVISDFLMPEMNGLEFLAKFKKRHPEAPRVMLTGYADKENSIRAINEVGLFQYIEKPWDNDQMKLVIHNALTNKSLRETLRARIRDLDDVLREREILARRDNLLREELDMAERLQRGMLPSKLPAIDGMGLSTEYVPALEVGGDFYDVIPLASDRWGFLIADVTGHGIQAALSTALVKFAFSDFKNCECNPNDIVAGMNRVLLRALPQDTFAAAMVLVISTTTGEIRLTNAGLPHPFVLRRTARRAERVPANGFVLGAIGEDVFQPEEEHVIRLEQGDLLMAYTDGLSEMQNAAGEQFDESMLTDTLIKSAGARGADIAKNLVTASSNFGDPEHSRDDITVLGVEKL